MALPPTIPTSFVPHASSETSRRYRVDFVGAFGFLSLGIFLVTIGLAIGVFLYAGVLNAQLKSKDEALAQAQKKIDSTLAHSFVRLNDRLSSGQVLLNEHVAFTNFFRTLGTLLPVTVRFSSLHVMATDANKVALEGTGVAKNFNALAAASASFAADGHIKDAIFSRIVVNRDNSVSFSLTATIDPKLIAFSAANLKDATPTTPAAPASAATTTQP